MPQIVVDCPHCGAKSLGMNVFGTHIPSAETVRTLGRNPFIVVTAICGNCSDPVSATVESDDVTIRSWNDFIDRAKKYSQDIGTPSKHGLKHSVIITPPQDISIPQHLPKNIEKSLKMAETNFRLPDSEEAAAAMYRRAIDLATKEINPGANGDLIKRINTLAEDNVLPGTMKDWAHQVRIIGNDGAHDEDGVNRTDLKAAQGFTDALLRYLFTLPKEVEIRRAETELTPVPIEVETGV